MDTVSSLSNHKESDDHASSSQAWIIFKDLLKHPLGATGFTILLFVVMTAIFSPYLVSVDPVAVDFNAIQQPPSSDYILGTDEIGRSMWSRIVYGSRVALKIILFSIGGALIIGTTIGLISGYAGGRVDMVIMRIMDGLLAFPPLVLALGIIAILGPDLINATIAIMVVNIPSFARLVRGAVLTVREQDYVLAIRALGASPFRIMRYHLLPNVVGNIIVFASLRASTALITEASLSFLGLGVQPPTPSWGYMIAIGMNYWDYWWMSFFPGLAIFITILGFNLFGDALRDVIDPHLRDSTRK